MAASISPDIAGAKVGKARIPQPVGLTFPAGDGARKPPIMHRRSRNLCCDLETGGGDQYADFQIAIVRCPAESVGLETKGP